MRVWKGGFMVDTLGHIILPPNVVFETLELYVLSVPSSTGGPWPRETTQASPRAQIVAPDRESSPLATPPGPLKLRLFGK